MCETDIVQTKLSQTMFLLHVFNTQNLMGQRGLYWRGGLIMNLRIWVGGGGAY